MTGLGIFSPAGNDPGEFFQNLLSGKSGIRKLSADDFPGLDLKIAAPVTFHPEACFSKRQIATLDRASQLALLAAEQAWKEAGPDLGEEEKLRAGVFWGTAMGGAHSIDEVFSRLYRQGASRVNPYSVPKIMSNAPASQISIRYGLGGPCLTYATACSASAVAVGEAQRQIRAGYVDVAVAGGSESLLTYGSFKCWESLGVMAPAEDGDPRASCRPFSRDRAGLVLGEGAAAVVLEEEEHARRRGAQIYGVVSGYATTADAHHITGPDVEGQTRCVRLALGEARRNIDEIDYINAHGTGTVVNDLVETRTIKRVFGENAYRIPVSSTKSMHGHLLGAAGAAELVASLLSIRFGALPPTANLRVPDPECDLDYVPNQARDGVRVKTVVSNSFAFGGTNAVLIAEAP